LGCSDHCESMGRPTLNIRGMRFGRLTIPLDATPEIRKRCLYWPCLCDCGASTIIKGDRLRTGRTQSCGCLRGSRMCYAMRGKRFSRLTIPLDAIPEYRNHHLYWPCVCDCGVRKAIRAELLRDGCCKSCGCWRADPSMRLAAKLRTYDLRGRRFGGLAVALDAVPEICEHHMYWPCVCDCGVKTVVRGDFLRNGRTQTCGCLRVEPAIEHRSEMEGGGRTPQALAGNPSPLLVQVP
jgi:hypothetical protein